MWPKSPERRSGNCNRQIKSFTRVSVGMYGLLYTLIIPVDSTEYLYKPPSVHVHDILISL